MFKNLAKPSLSTILICILCLITFLIGGAAGIIISGNSPKSNAQSEEKHQNNLGLVSPLLFCDTNPETNPVQVIALESRLNKYVNQKLSNPNINHISIYYRDLNNGPWFGINQEENFSPASLLKVAIMIAILKHAETNPPLLEQRIIFDQQYTEQSTYFEPNLSIQIGEEYTIEELLYYMIAHSDNNAKDLLLLNIDSLELNSTFTDLGYNSPFNQAEDSVISVKTYASFFRILFNASYLNRQLSQKALTILTQTEFPHGISQRIPQNITIAHKFGERSYDYNQTKQLHDCGIIYHPQNPYLLCIMTRGSQFQTLSDLIGEISSLIFTDINQQYPSSIPAYTF
jgi:beta-lactamase class A